MTPADFSGVLFVYNKVIRPWLRVPWVIWEHDHGCPWRFCCAYAFCVFPV